MSLRQLMNTLRRSGQRVPALAFLGAASLAVSAIHPDLFAEEVTNVGRFQIPFDVETEPGQPAEGFAVLFGSQDGGAHWDRLNTVPAGQKSFTFSAQRDGRYSFAIRMADAQGNLLSGIEGSAPELDVVVDTVAPQLKLELFEPAPGNVVVNWTSTDSHVAPESLAIEYSDGADGRWKPVQFQPTANGQAKISASVGSVISVRAAITDTAGNRGEASTQIVSKANSATGANSATPLSNLPPGAPLGVSPFGAGMNSHASGFPAKGFPKAATSVNATLKTNMATGFPQVTPAAALNTGGLMNVGPNVAGQPAPLGAMSNDAQVVNAALFDLDYQVEDVGPSGVSAVELFITANGGQQWYRYENDPDMKSPFQVDTQEEGTFGFAVRVRNGLGFIDTPPQPGQAPEIVVTVDQTAPIVEMAQPAIRTEGGFGTLQLSWRMAEQNASTTPVRLEQATSPNGPWTTVFDWQADQGGYQMAIRQGTPPALYFKLLARDAAGNVGVAQSSQPVIVDMKKPVGRLLRVQAVSNSTPRY